MNNLIKKIAIVGRDADAWITALLLIQTFTDIEHKPEITLIELPADLTRQDFFSVLPSHKILHKMLGANEKKLLKTAKGHYCFAQRFSNWCGGAEPYMHAYDRFGLDFDGIDFYQYWLKAVANGLKVRFEDFNLGAVAAKHQKYVVFRESDKTFSHASYGYHLSAIDYIKAIAKAVVAQGVKHIQSRVTQVTTSGATISSITLADGQEVEADFFIDASGVESVLIKKVEEKNIEKWSHWLPADHIMVASAGALKSFPSFSQISAFKEGWFGIYPLLDRTAINFVYSSKYIKPEKLAELASAFVGMPINDITDTPFSAGTRKKHWIGNCLAVGSSAVSLEPLDAVQLQPLHIGLSLLISLFPNDKHYMPEADIYNKKISEFIENIRDYQIAHYHLNKRYGDEYWDGMRQADVPDSLRQKIDLFKKRGVVSLNDNEIFLQENWMALFVGQKLETESYDPLVDNASDEDQMRNFQKLLHYIKNEVEHMPSMQAHIEMNLM